MNIFEKIKLKILRFLLKLLRMDFSAIAKHKSAISARVYRAKTGKWEDLGVISRPEVDENIINQLKRKSI